MGLLQSGNIRNIMVAYCLALQFAKCICTDRIFYTCSYVIHVSETNGGAIQGCITTIAACTLAMWEQQTLKTTFVCGGGLETILTFDVISGPDYSGTNNHSGAVGLKLCLAPHLSCVYAPFRAPKFEKRYPTRSRERNTFSRVLLGHYRLWTALHTTMPRGIWVTQVIPGDSSKHLAGLTGFTCMTVANLDGELLHPVKLIIIHHTSK